MNVTSNLKPGLYLEPEPLARLLAPSVLERILKDKEDESMAVERLEDLKEDLHEFMDLEDDLQRVSTEEETGRAFRIRSLEQADWAVRKIARLEARRQECRDLVETESAKLAAWLKKQEEEADRERSFFDSLLRDYLEEQRQQDPRLKTIKLPHGKVGLRKQQPEYIRDNDQLLTWLRANRPELVKVKAEPDWAGVKAAATVLGDIMADPDTGEVIEGIRVVERPEKLAVDFE